MRGAVSMLLTVTLLGAGPFARASASGGAVAGTVTLADGGVPLAGARVHARDRVGDREFVSPPADAAGRFRIDGLPAAEFRLAVEWNGALHVAEAPVAVTADTVRRVAVAVRPEGALAPAGAWDSNLGSAALIVGGAILLGLALESLTDPGNEEPVASPFAP